MGCWCETCMLSNLPICEGDDVVIIPLFNRFGRNMSYYYGYEPTDCYCPLPPIIGKYNDYGGVENIQISNFQLELYKKYVFKKLERKEDKDVYSDIHIENQNDLETLLEDAGEYTSSNNLFVDKPQKYPEVYHNKFPSVNFYICHKPIYDELIKTYYPKCAQYVFKAVDFFIKFFIKYREEYTSVEYLEEWIFNACQINVNECVKYAVELGVFTHALNYLRLGYCCVSGMGSQNIDLESHIHFHEFIANFAKTKLKELKEYNKLPSESEDSE